MKSLAFAFAMFCLAGLPLTGTAQSSYPDKPINLVVPYPAGGGTDALSRLVGKYLSESWKQPVVIENRAGANGQIGMDLVKKTRPDGYSLLAMATGPLNEENIGDYTMISLFAAPAYILVVHPGVKAGTVPELIALAKAKPGSLAYGSTGGGAASHLAAELFKSMSGTDMLHVPYKGVGAAVSDLLGGHVQLMFAPPQAVVAHIKSGALRALGVTGPIPMSLLPELPPIAKAGVPGYDAVGWFGLIGPAGMPRDIVTRLNREITRILQLPDMQQRLRELGAEPAALSPEEFLAFVRADNAKWARLIKEKGIVIEGAK